MSNIAVSLTVNGHDRVCRVPPRQTLLGLLRDDLGLTGTKEGCGNGNCGACTVILNGVAVYSCLVLAAEVEGARVTTIEGLADRGRLHPLQRAFVERGAIQCGFCTPGMILTAKALLDRKPHPSEAEIRRALAGNLCRCTGYDRIVAAVRQTCGGAPAPEEGLASPIGVSVPRIDAAEKATGMARYAADIRLEGALTGKVLFSSHPHARIVRINTSRAERLPGVWAVITAADFVPHRFGLRDDREALARDKVLFTGDRVAAVAAEDDETARAALGLIEVEYDPLPGVFDPVEAMRTDAAALRETRRDFDDPSLGPNVAGRTLCEIGDVDKGFKQADLIFEDTFVTQRAHQAYLEPRACLACPEAQGGITIWTSTQSPFGIRASVAKVLGLPLHRVCVRPTVVGGAFGGKIEALLEPLAARLAQLTGRPVRMALSRREELTASQTRGRNVLYLKTGVTHEGMIVAREGRFVFDMGASGDDSESLTYLGNGAYATSNVRLTGLSVYTNHITTSPFRAPKVPQLMFALESQMDRIARSLHLDPLDIRRRNAIATEGTWPNGMPAGAIAIAELLERAAQRARWAYRRSGATADGKLTGWGIACAPWPIWMDSTSTADVIVNDDSSVLVVTGVVDLTGAHTALAQITADQLGIDVGRVSVIQGDTGSVPFNDTAAGSRTLSVTGIAVLRGVDNVRRQLCDAFARSRGVPITSVVVENGCVRAIEQGGRSVTRAGVVGRGSDSLSLGEAAKLRRDSGLGSVRGAGMAGRLPPAMAFAVQIAHVEVDPETGGVRVLRLITAQDVGRAINPAAVEGQISGGAAQGIGYGLFEEHLCRDGHVLNPTFLDYRLPTTLDVPEFENVIVDGPPSAGPYGAHGVGEPPICPTAAAIANAVYDAIGIQIKELPLTPERVLAALQAKGSG